MVVAALRDDALMKRNKAWGLSGIEVSSLMKFQNLDTAPFVFAGNDKFFVSSTFY